MNLIKKILISLVVILVLVGAYVAWSVRGTPAQFALNDTTGPRPKLADPDEQTIPTIKTADPIGWKDGETPVEIGRAHV